MDLLITDEFRAALDSFEQGLRAQALHKVQLLADNPFHPSLQVHRIRNTDNKWECYVNVSHRIIYDREDGLLRLWRVGDHRIIDRVRNASFAPHTQFFRPSWEEESAATAEAVAPPTYTFAAPTPTPGPFAHFSPTYLRLLGVPAHLVAMVRALPEPEALEQVDGLLPQTLVWLLELLTNPDLEEVLFDPGRLLYRTTLDMLDGYCQGSIRQLMLNLAPEQQQYVRAPRPGITVLKGVAGSGKTTVGIYRAVERAQEGRRVLLLTFSRTLNAVTRTLIESLIGPLPENLEVVNIDRWIGQFLTDRGHALRVLDEPAAFALLQEALASVRREGREAVLQQKDEWFREEIARVIKGAGLRTAVQYLNVERHGRRTALAPDQRMAVWRVYEAYQARLEREGAQDWRDPAVLAYTELLERPLPAPYDDVIIDEGQDLTAQQLRVAQRLIRGGDPLAQRSLLLLGDAAQTIYSRGFSWRQAGIPAQGRTFTLRKNHRNTRQIAEMAALLLSQNKWLRATEEFVEPEWTQRQGPWPLVIRCQDQDRELRAVRERILDLVSDQQFRVSDFVVLCPTNRLCEQVRNHLEAAHLPCVLHKDDEFDLLEEQVKVMTIHAAKGLEFPVVFVVGVREGALPDRGFFRFDQEERELELERQRTLFYVAMTRAAEALFLVTTEGAESGFLRELGPQLRTEAFALSSRQ